MTRLPEIEKLLKDWGEWATQRDKGVSGYPSISPHARLTPSSTLPDRLPEDPVFLEVDKIMSALKRRTTKITKKTDPDYLLYRIGWLWYAASLPESRITALCRISLSTFYNKLYRLRSAVKKELGKK